MDFYHGTNMGTGSPLLPERDPLTTYPKGN
jgi:hypothetical protein